MKRTAAQQLGDVLLTTARKAAEAAAQSVIDDARSVAAEVARRIRAAMPANVQQPSSQPPPQRIHVDARTIK